MGSSDGPSEDAPAPAPKPGTRVCVSGGYDTNPEWLNGRPAGYLGTLLGYMPGQNELPAALVELDEPIHEVEIRGEVVSGAYLILEQAWVGVPWGPTSPRVHVELCDFMPESRPWAERRQGFWAESHASFRVVD
jgi:hypothetical protein